MTAPSRPLLGRDAVLDDLRTLLDVEQVVALVGPPGIGKSAVARALEPPVWIDLEGVSTPETLRQRVARAVGAPRANDDALQWALRDVAWAVLDGAEDVSDSLGDVLGLGPATAWLVTSRRAVEEAGSLVELGPLEPEVGAELLRQCVRSARRRDALDAEALAALSRAVDGVPLALELLAPRLRLAEPEAVGRDLGGVLDDPSRPPRRQLGPAIRQMVDALDPVDRAVLDAAVTLPGAFSVDELGLAAGRDATAPALRLLDAALLHPHDAAPPTFRVLAPIASAVEVEREPVVVRMAPQVLADAEAGVADEDWTRLEALRPRLELVAREARPPDRLGAAGFLMLLDERTGEHAVVVAHHHALPASVAAELAPRAADALRILGRLDDAHVVLDGVTGPEAEVIRGTLLASAGEVEAGVDHALSALCDAPDADPGLWRFVGAMQLDLGQTERAIPSLRRALDSVDPVRRVKSAASLANALQAASAPPSEIEAVLDRVDLAAYPVVRAPILLTRAWLRVAQGDIAEAVQAFGEGEQAANALGQPGMATSAFLYGQLVGVADGHPPRALLQPLPYDVGPYHHALAKTLQVLAHATLGHADAAIALEPVARAELRPFSERAWIDHSAILAVALAPFARSRSEEILAELSDDPMVDAARELLAGREIPAETVDQRVLLGLRRLQRGRVQVSRDGSGFTDATGQRVDIARRRVLRKVLAALANAEEPLDVAGICDQVWPGEALVGGSGTRRVHVAISTLRGLGLKQAIRTVETADGTAWELVATREEA